MAHPRPVPAALSRRWPSIPHVALLLLGASLLLGACSSAHQATATRLFRVGFLGFSSPEDLPWIAPAAQAELAARGYVEGKNLHIEWRWAGGESSRVPLLAAELARLKPDVLVAGGDPMALALQQVTSTIPIVFGLCGDPVRQGFVASLAHPGGNLTGYTFSCSGTQGDEKRLEFLKAILPQATRVALLWYSATSDIDLQLASIAQAAQTLGLTAQLLEVQKPEDLPGAIEAATSAHADGLLVVQSSFMNSNREQLFGLALQHRLPAFGSTFPQTDAGALLGYSSPLIDNWRQAFAYIDPILRGAKPAELPVRQPTTFEIVVNLKTAQALGITIPDSVLVQATAVIR